MEFTNGIQYDSRIGNILLDEETLNILNNIKITNSKLDIKSLTFSPQNLEEKKQDELFISKEENNILSYYSTTIDYLKNSSEYSYFNSFNLNSKNYISKNKICRYCEGNTYDEKYITNNEIINNNKNFVYNINNNNNYLSDEIINDIDNIKAFNNSNRNLHNNLFTIVENNINKHFIVLKEDEQKKISNGYLKKSNINSENNLINANDFTRIIPSNYYVEQKENKILTKSQSNDTSSKDKETESDSTSEISEKKEEEYTYTNENKLEKSIENKRKLKKEDYIIEKFGKKGWICKLCNNFNYETRNKCNRCGIWKCPKLIADIKQRNKYHKIIDNKDKNKNKDWICNVCRNLNYSFRVFCNRCKIPKMNESLDNPNYLDVNYIEKYPIYSFSPSFNFYNILRNDS